jgi:pimeloyl-ACP methyl ester carboxylesterase
MNVRTLLMLGGDSPAHFPAGAEMLRAGLPRTETVVLPGQQHQAMTAAPALFVSEVVRFLKAP